MIFKVALVVSEFNKEITDNLVMGAQQEYSKIFRLPLDNFDIYRIPGAFELPGTIHKILKSNKKYHGIIAFGSIIKGDTAHFESNTEVINYIENLLVLEELLQEDFIENETLYDLQENC